MVENFTKGYHQDGYEHSRELLTMESRISQLLESLHDEDWRVRRSAAEELARIGTPALPGLLEALRSGPRKVCLVVIPALGQLGDTTAVPDIIQALGGTDSSVRRLAAKALGAIGDPTAVPALLEALRTGDKGLRRNAAEALGGIGHPSAVPGLLAMLQNRDHSLYMPKVFMLIFDTLRRIGQPAVPDLLDALNDKSIDWETRGSIARVLGDIGDPRAVPDLLMALRDHHLPSHAVSYALGELGGPHGALDLFQANLFTAIFDQATKKIEHPLDVPTLLQTLSDQDSQVRRFAARALGYMGDLTAVPALIERLHDQSSEVRYEAAQALGWLEDARAVPDLIELLSDTEKPTPRWYLITNERIQDVAARALRRIGTPEAIAALETRRTTHDS